MAYLKMKKMPKRPKASASVATKESWLKRAAAVKAENARRVSANKRSVELSRRIASFK